MKNKIIIGTRGSQLALYQANETKRILNTALPNLTIDIKIIKTKGDKILDVSLSKIGDKGLFTKELEVALLNNEVDIAVHSLKDLPTVFPDGLKLGAVLPRGEVRDALVSRQGKRLEELDENDVVATSSLRRKAQLLAYNPKFNIVDIRGNMNTRLQKMDEGYCDAMIMAATGLQRLGLEERITQVIDTDLMLPAVSQGAIGIESREHDPEMDAILEVINDDETMTITRAERIFLRLMEGGCQIPIGCFSEKNGDSVRMIGMVADLTGKRIIKKSAQGELQNVDELAGQIAREMLASGAKEILDEIRDN